MRATPDPETRQDARFSIASGRPCSAAARVQRAASAGFGSTPQPDIRATPRLCCASECPCSAARRNQRMAFAWLFFTPLPFRKDSPIPNCPSALPFSAAARNQLAASSGWSEYDSFQSATRRCRDPGAFSDTFCMQNCFACFLWALVADSSRWLRVSREGRLSGLNRFGLAARRRCAISKVGTKVGSRPRDSRMWMAATGNCFESIASRARIKRV